jgi:hypothetical protein
MFYAILIGLIAILYAVITMKETFVLKYGNPFDDEDLVSFDTNAKGKRLFGTTPDTCPCHKPELDGGLCYERCDPGYHGDGPVCWADTENIGAGKVLLLKSCDQSGYVGWTDTGLLCNEPITCGKGWEFFTKGCRGGNVREKNLSCDGYDGRYPDEIAALCYRRCPKDKPNHATGMPYLCYKGERGLSYGRGVGDVPAIMSFGGCNSR